MATETLKEFRKMAKDQLAEREQELRTELFKLRTTNATEKVKDRLAVPEDQERHRADQDDPCRQHGKTNQPKTAKA